MSSEISMLLDLQKLDIAILELDRERQAYPQKLAEITTRLNTLKGEQQREREALKQMVKDRRLKELELNGEVEKVRKWEERLNRGDVKTNREYQALLREIEIAKQINSDLETEILELMTRIEEMEKRVGEFEARIEETEKEFEESRKEAEKRCKELDKKIEQQGTDRNKIARGMSADLLARYDLIRRRKNGFAIAEAKGGACQACHINLPPQLYNIIVSGVTIEICPSCQRLLHFGAHSSERGE